MNEVILIDACNIMHCRQASRRLMAANFDSAVDQLFEDVRVLHDSGFAEVHLIVDGKQSKLNQIFPSGDSRLSIVYTPVGLTADAILERWAARLQDHGRFKIYTDDLAIRQTALSYGGEAAGASTLFDDIERLQTKAGRDLELRRKKIDKTFGTSLFSSSNERYETRKRRRGGEGPNA